MCRPIQSEYTNVTDLEKQNDYVSFSENSILVCEILYISWINYWPEQFWNLLNLSSTSIRVHSSEFKCVVRIVQCIINVILKLTQLCLSLILQHGDCLRRNRNWFPLANIWIYFRCSFVLCALFLFVYLSPMACVQCCLENSVRHQW